MESMNMEPVDVESGIAEPVSAPEPSEPAVKKSAWQWIGSPDRPEAQKSVDGISDLFEFKNEADTDDVVSVDVDRDIVDADADGSLDSLVTVTEEDIMGYGPYSQPRKHKVQRGRRQSARNTDPRIGGLR
jgi:hypothetical protein